MKVEEMAEAQKIRSEEIYIMNLKICEENKLKSSNKPIISKEEQDELRVQETVKKAEGFLQSLGNCLKQMRNESRNTFDYSLNKNTQLDITQKTVCKKRRKKRTKKPSSPLKNLHIKKISDNSLKIASDFSCVNPNKAKIFAQPIFNPENQELISKRIKKLSSSKLQNLSSKSENENINISLKSYVFKRILESVDFESDDNNDHLENKLNKKNDKNPCGRKKKRKLTYKNIAIEKVLEDIPLSKSISGRNYSSFKPNNDIKAKRDSIVNTEASSPSKFAYSEYSSNCKVPNRKHSIINPTSECIKILKCEKESNKSNTSKKRNHRTQSILFIPKQNMLNMISNLKELENLI